METTGGSWVLPWADDAKESQAKPDKMHARRLCLSSDTSNPKGPCTRTLVYTLGP